jgi:hypothetical protein
MLILRSGRFHRYDGLPYYAGLGGCDGLGILLLIARKANRRRRLSSFARS